VIAETFRNSTSLNPLDANEVVNIKDSEINEVEKSSSGLRTTFSEMLGIYRSLKGGDTLPSPAV
jgi:hypothetical protein